MLNIIARCYAGENQNGIKAAFNTGDYICVHPIANEDLDRQTEAKTSAVHFLRFELTPDMAAAAKAGASIRMGVDHPHYEAELTLTAQVRDALAADLA